MAKSPILGGFSTQRSPNAADNIAVNLGIEIVETKDGKVPGFLFGTSGLDLLNSVGSFVLTGAQISSGGGEDYTVGEIITLIADNGEQLVSATLLVTSVNAGAVTSFTITNPGLFRVEPTLFTQQHASEAGFGFSLSSPTYDTKGPVRGALPLNGVLYVVAGAEVWSVSPNGGKTYIGNVGDQTTPVSMFQNKRQLMIVDGVGAWIVPGGLPLTGGTINAAGGLYAVNDTIALKASSGVQNAFPEVTVKTVSDNPVLTFTVPNGGTGYVTNVSGNYTISSGTYNNGTGLVTLTLSVSAPNVPGQQITVSNLTGTGAFVALNGVYLSAAGTTGTTLTYSAASGLGATTITGGKVAVAAVTTTNIQPQPGGGTGLTINITAAGPITAASVTSGGVNYAANDTGVITAGSQDAVYRVVSVAGGVVTALILVNRGTAYATTSAATTKAEPGNLPVNVGVGFTVNLTAVAGAVTAATVATGGHGYVVGATGFISGGGVDATYLISSVGPVGSVNSFIISQPGAIVDPPLSFTQKSTSGSGSGFILTAPTFGAYVGLVPIVMPFPNPMVGGISDGFGLLVFLNSQNLASSDQSDLSTWQPLSFGVANQSPDNCISLSVIHDEVYVLKENNTEIWNDQGLANFPFGPLSSNHIEFGCVAPFSVAHVDQELIWLSRNDQGEGIVIRVSGYSAEPISTQALVNEFQKYANLGDAIAYGRQEGQHVYYVITFPEANKSWQYDKTSSKLAGFPIWTELAAFDNGELNRHWGNCFTPYRTSGQPTTTTTSYQPTSVKLTRPTVLETVDGLSGLPTGVSSLLFSMWLDMPDADGSGIFWSNQTDDSLGATNPGLWMKLQNDTQGTPQFSIKAWDASNAIILNATYDFTNWPNWVNLLISIDTASNKIQVYANTIVSGSLVETHITAASLTWSSTNPIDFPVDQPWHIAAVS